ILESWISEETVRLLLKRSSNTVFIGLPLRRDPDWIDLNVRTTVDALKGDIIVALFTKFMRRYVAAPCYPTRCVFQPADRLVARFTNSSHLHRTLYEQCMRKLTPMSAKWLLRPSVPSDDNTHGRTIANRWWKIDHSNLEPKHGIRKMPDVNGGIGRVHRDL
ncbi:hypothetical protein EV363DRAFT_1168366, partial [Boletus edulis]